MLANAEHYFDIDKPAEYFRFNRLMNYLFASVLLTFIFGVLTYGEKFRLWEYAYSYIGMFRTPGGSPNTTAMLVYLAGNLFNSIICFKIRNIYFDKFHRIIFGICGAGFLLLMLPCDIINPVHAAGGAMVFGTLWVYALVRIRYLNHTGEKIRAILCFLLLNGTILPYAYLYFINSPDQIFAQKPAMLGLIIVLKLVILKNKEENKKDSLKREIIT
jgi:hypothetical protein